jgi:phosphonate transport system substrate-binding protein
MRFNKVQVAWMGNKSAMEAVDRSNAEIFAKIVGLDGTEGYYSLLVVHKDSPLKNLDDVLKQHASLTLGFGDPNSTSGTAVPGLYAFADNHVDPLKDFKRTVRANHETNLLAVVNKQVDVATNNTENVQRFGHTHPEQVVLVREIWRSPLIASDPIVWRKDLDDATKKQLRDFMLTYGRDAREQAILKNIGYTAFRPSTNAQLVPIRQIELARERSKIESDTGLAAADKAKKLQEIDARIAELGRQLASAK